MAEYSAIHPYPTTAAGPRGLGCRGRKLRHDPMELVSRAIQPALWLVLFGQVMAQVRGLVAERNELSRLFGAGHSCQSVLFVAIFYGIETIWERDLGVLHRYFVSPAPRTALVLGKALSSTVRGLSQAIVVYVLAFVPRHPTQPATSASLA